MENIDKNLDELINELNNALTELAELARCNGCGHIFKPSKQEALEIVMKQFREYLAIKGMKKLSRMCSGLGYTPAELGITGISVSLDGKDDGAPGDGTRHRYEIFLKSGASRFVTADEILYDEELDESTCDVLKTIQFLFDGRIVAQFDRDIQFIVCDEED